MRPYEKYDDNWQEVPDDYTKDAIIYPVRDLGRDSGLTERELRLLNYYMGFTKDIDWKLGGRPIVWTSLERAGQDLGVSERRIQQLEDGLYKKGFITFTNDGSGCFRRYGYRENGREGRVIEACGVNLAPLAYQNERVKSLLQERIERDARKKEIKKRISAYRGKISRLFRVMDCAELEADYAELSMPIRLYMGIKRRLGILEGLKALYERVKAAFEADQQVSEEESFESQHVTPPPAPDGAVASRPHKGLTQAQVLAAASDEFMTRYHANAGRGQGDFWRLLFVTARDTADALGISKHLFGRAVKEIGEVGAAISILLVDEKVQSGYGMACPARYFNGMLKKSRTGDLNLTGSLIGAYERSGTSNISAMH